MKQSIAALLSLVLATASLDASGATYTNIMGVSVEFPAGDLSFADQLVSFTPGIVAGQPNPPYLDGTNTLGVPDVTLAQSVDCALTPSTATCRFASLGSLGSLTVRFVDNVLRGSGTSDLDLYVFQAGPRDDAAIDVSVDGLNWLPVGVLGASSGVDLDAFGYGPSSVFAFVRLTDLPGGQTSGATLGADIDAIGAVATTAVVPLPATAWLLLSALAGLGVGCRRL